jgi:hypothetical protein
MPGLNLFTNNAATTLASGITSIATSLTVATGDGAEFPTLAGSQYFYCTIANNAGAIEIIKVTARSTDTFTIVRGQDGTSAAAWSAGDKVELRLNRIDLLNFPQLDSTNTFALAQTFTAAPVFTNQSGTRTAMSAAASGANSDITSLTGLTTPLSVAQGGTGQSSYTNGQLLIGNTTGNTLTKATLTAGTGISVTNSTGSITIANTLSGGFSNMQVFTGPGTFTTPATTTNIKVTVVGGGGGGSGPSPVEAAGGSGGTSSFGSLASATGGVGSFQMGINNAANGANGGAGTAGTLQIAGSNGVGGTMAATPAGNLTSMGGQGGATILGGMSGSGSNPGPAPTGTTRAGKQYGGGGAGFNTPGSAAFGVGGAGGGGAAIYVGPVTASTPYAVTVGAGGVGTGSLGPAPTVIVNSGAAGVVIVEY